MSLDKTPAHLIKALRLVRKPTAGCKAAMLSGCLEQGAYTQWGEDLRTGTLWSALRSAESYEIDGHYAVGTVAAALKASLTKGVLKRAAWWETELATLRTKIRL